MFALFASGFFSRLSDIPFNDQVVAPGGGITVIQNFGSSRTIGTELEMILRPAPRFEIAMRTTVQNPVFTKLRFVDPEDGELDFAGNQVKRIPLMLFSFKPTYQHRRFSVHATWEYVGDRFANNRNTFVLPAYSIVDLGASVTLVGVTLSADALNLFNARGLTEGNPRIDESLSAEEAAAIDVLMGRPVLPRAFKMALAYTF